MMRNAKTVAVLAGLLLLGVAAAQRLTPIVLVLPSGQTLPYALDSRAVEGARVPTACYAASRNACRMGFFTLDVDGEATDVPFDMIARADLMAPGSETVWRFTLKDGRVLDGTVADADAHFYTDGVSDCCQNLVLHAYPRRPGRQSFVAVIFAAGESPPPAPTGP
jgi:hypothetical protein